MHGREASSCKIWCRYLYPVRSYWHFSEIQDGDRRHLGFSGYENLAIPVCWQCGICVLYQILLKYMQWLLRSTNLCFRCSFDDVTQINFRFRLLVTWSSAHGKIRHLPLTWPVAVNTVPVWCDRIAPLKCLPRRIFTGKKPPRGRHYACKKSPPGEFIHGKKSPGANI